MNKIDLIEGILREVVVTRNEAENVVEAICGGMVRSLRRGEKVEIRGFGSFRIRQRNPRKGRNPKTGAAVPVPAKKVPYFTPGKDLKAAINGAPGSRPT